jgi:hypothetical protein
VSSDQPAAWGPGIANRQRIVYPALIGIAFGLLLIVIDLSFHVTRVAMYLVWHVAYGNFVCQC